VPCLDRRTRARSKLRIRIESLQIGGRLAKEFETRQLGRSGVHVTVLGFGGGPVGTFINSEADAIACDTIDSAWDEGIRYFDTAPLYGLNRSERRVGSALADRPRDEFIVSTKVGRLIRTGGKPAPEQDPSSALGVIFDYSRHGTLASFEESLGRLNLRRVDVLLIHDIDHWTHGDRQSEAFAAALEGAYPVLADLKAKGRVRAIGLGVNEWQICRDFAKRAEIDCVLLAGRFTLLEQEPAREFLPFCLERGIGDCRGAFQQRHTCDRACRGGALQLRPGATGNRRTRPSDRRGGRSLRLPASSGCIGVSASPSCDRLRDTRHGQSCRGGRRICGA
jgi:aryl-alcohol dehydrogenase-like predicted oxidoreductase